jgi:copper chaperone CopZ
MEVPGVSDAVVSLQKKEAVVTADSVDIDALIEAVAEEGYAATAR